VTGVFALSQVAPSHQFDHTNQGAVLFNHQDVVVTPQALGALRGGPFRSAVDPGWSLYPLTPN